MYYESSMNALKTVLVEGLLKGMESTVTDELVKAKLAELEKEIRPIIQAQVSTVVKNFAKVTTGIKEDLATGRLVIQVNLQDHKVPVQNITK